MSKTAAIPMDKEIQSFLFTFTGQQYKIVTIQQSILTKSPSIVGSELLQTKVRLYFKEGT